MNITRYRSKLVKNFKIKYYKNSGEHELSYIDDEGVINYEIFESNIGLQEGRSKLAVVIYRLDKTERKLVNYFCLEKEDLTLLDGCVNMKKTGE